MMKRISGKILNYIYLSKLEGDKVPPYEEIINNSKYPVHQVKMAIEYCEQNGFLKIIKLLGGNIIIRDITATGIDIVSDEKEFKKHFSFGVSLGLVNFKWGAEEK